MSVLQRFSLSLIFTLFFTACESSNFADVLKDTTTEEASVACSASSSSPSTTTYKMSNPAGTTTNFVVVPNDSGCTIAWKLNGNTLSGTTAIQSITSADLNAGSNTVEATLTNSLGSSTRTWTVTRNQVPTCASKLPVANPTPHAFGYTPNLSYSGTFADADSDTLSGISWSWNGSTTPSAIYTAQASTTTTPGAANASMTFVPTISQTGTGNTLSVSLTDGYDTGTCSWNFTLTNPNVVQLLSCSPSTSPIVIDSTGAGNSENLTINTLNAATFSWTKDAVTIGGASSSSYLATSTNPTFGNYTYVATASDLDSNQVTCTYTVKMNGPPAISTASPLTSQSWRVNYGSTLGFTVTATDPNSDSLTYVWKLDGAVQSTYLNSTTSSATFAPGSTESLVNSNNPHTISVTISDGNEETTQSWTVEVNKFSTECNTLLNGTVSSHGGKVCTLAGPVGVGSARRPADDQSLMRLQPIKIIDDGYGNWFIMDALSHSVFYYNRTGINPFTGDRSGCVADDSTCSITIFNKTIGGGATAGDTGQMVALMGNGSAGQSDEDLTNTSGKLSIPHGGLAFDAAERFLYVTDWNNNRVVRLDGRTGGTNGQVKTVFGAIAGATAPSNNTTGNNDGNVTSSGTPTVNRCANPVDVMLAGTSPNKYLYITCYTDGTIKRMKADFSGGDSSNYGKGYMFVGSLIGGVSSYAATDGAIGSTYGNARTAYPWSLSKDSAGNIYWTEGSQGSNLGGRLRVYNNTGSTLQFFNGNTSSSYTSNRLNATEHTTASITTSKAGHAGTPAGGVDNTAYSSATAAVARLRVIGPTSVATNSCVEYRAQALDASNVPVKASANATINVTIAGGTGDIYNDSGCTTSTLPVAGAAGSRTITIPSSSNEISFYYKNTAAEARTLAFSSAGFQFSFNNAGMGATPQNFTITTAAAGAQDHIAMFTPIATDKDTCTLITLQMQVITTNAVATASADRYFNVNSNGFGSFYSDSSCTTPTNSVTIANGTSYGKIYFKTNINIAAGKTGSILGFANNTTANPTSAYPTANTNVTHGNMNFAQPRGLAVYEVSSVVKGFFISSFNHHRIYFMNNNAGTLSIGGNSVPSNTGGVVAGGNAAAFDTDGDGVATRLNTPTGLNMAVDNSMVLVADQLNYRARALDLSNTGTNNADLFTLIGSGFPRAGTAGTATTAANATYLSAPIGIAADSATKTLYISDSGNKYIRSLSLLTGQVDTAAGTGLSATAPNDGSTPTNATINSPRGMTIHSPAGKKFLLFADTQTATANTLFTDNGNGGTDRHNHIGSINLGSTGTMFTGGSSFVSGKYTTAIADYGLGNAPYGGAGGTTISYGANTNTAISFMSVDDVASDGTNIYVVSRADHCIVKVAANGSSSVVVGQADAGGSKCLQTSTTALGFPTATTSAGQARTITIRAPTAIIVDPRYAGDGNFFFADSPDVAGGSTIRYANFRATGVNVGSDYVNGSATAGEAYIKTLSFINYMNPASSYAWVSDLAAITTIESSVSVTQFCVAGGRHDNAMLGTHHVTCYSLDDTVTPGAQSLRLGGIPGSALSIRSGAPLGVEQEGVNASAALLQSPSGLSFDSVGNLYVAERGNHVIRFVRKWWQ